MSPLSLAGVSDDGKRLLLVSDRGEEFTLDITPALRAALRGQPARFGQLEIQMSSTLRPRDIQDRVRAGESPEEVAEAAGSTVEAIMPYAGPVIAEREHVAQRAQQSSLRRPADGTSNSQARRLGDAVGEHLRANDARPDQVSWDARRREDGRWVLTADFHLAGSSGSAEFIFDAPGNYVLPDNDDALRLIGDAVATAATPDAAEPAAGRRHLAAVVDQLPLGDDAIDMVSDEPVDEPDNTPAPAPGVGAAPDAGEPAAEDVTDVPAAEAEPPQRRTPAKKRGRASVPSWDEIMFGGGDQ